MSTSPEDTPNWGKGAKIPEGENNKDDELRTTRGRLALANPPADEVVSNKGG